MAAQVRADEVGRQSLLDARARQRADHAGQRAGRAKVNLTDPACRLMKAAGGWVQGYNAQAAVAQDGTVVAAGVVQDHNDVAQCVPMMAAVAENLAAAGVSVPVGVMLFDAGYFSEANITAPGPDRLIATTKTAKLRRAAKDNGCLAGDPPLGASPIHAMQHRLMSEEGARLYGLRQHTVEPVFGQAKYNRGFLRFMRRGCAAVDAEWKLIALTHNLLKLHRYGPPGLAAI
jgi:hypothetical protein